MGGHRAERPASEKRVGRWPCSFPPRGCRSGRGLFYRAKAVLGYTDSELCRQGSGYQFIHAADAAHCAENHVRSESGGALGPPAPGAGAPRRPPPPRLPPPAAPPRGGLPGLGGGQGAPRLP